MKMGICKSSRFGSSSIPACAPEAARDHLCPKASLFVTQELRECMLDALSDEDCVFLEDISDPNIQNLVDSYDELSEAIAELQHQARCPDSKPARFRLTKTLLDSFATATHPNFPTVLRYDDKWQEIILVSAAQMLRAKRNRSSSTAFKGYRVTFGQRMGS
ncbi:hypothetical protein AC579_5979 [Pseudocercospora musae]|uniref:Uncharacterized protein n=1 Tax=Pseudocercospora musae TaxID=113226 RepID=A0A139HZW2_9PEZI|nr:hypothetical protein AC579_5979 [Pseudocercospora musae]